jgi:hypothetical protein
MISIQKTKIENYHHQQTLTNDYQQKTKTIINQRSKINDQKSTIGNQNRQSTISIWLSANKNHQLTVKKTTVNIHQSTNNNETMNL